MKVLHILDHSLPLHSGYTFRSQNIILSQVRRGWKPIVLTSPKHEESLKQACTPQEVQAGITYYRSGSVERSSIPFLTEIRMMAALRTRLVELCVNERPDILHAHSPVLNGLPSLWVSRQLGLPLVYEVRAFWEDAAVDHGSYVEGSAKYQLVKALETFVCRQANHVAVLCQGVKNDLIQRGIAPGKMTVVYNGVNVEGFQPCAPDEEFKRAWGLHDRLVIGFIGSFYRYEGLDLLILAMADVIKVVPNAMLLLVGGGEVEGELRKQIVALGIEKSVVLPGRIPHERIPGVYALVDVLAYPRHPMRLTELVTPLKPLEAMAMGKALVASAVGGHRELIQDGETGVLFQPGNANSLAKSLDLLLTNHAFRKHLEMQGIRWVRKERSWDATTACYSSIYSAVLGRSVSSAPIVG
ncbi:MAG: TIGR04063 family PEP-CTERM/XrtA system glycosyltransferase [Nitrospira sp.]|jgi:PEP-CTERM/exosortase A-associated glycosyltransferase